ncbi:radical SAM protein [Paraburkholderia strydomiana]|uniref:radical SAM protein n=1 Tax=Paraburkholderia strydomiana TaxID=1245417 RepID=UPI0038BC4356
MSASDRPRCRLVVAKIASRCNLNCSYCYMYNMGDQTYREQPKVMSDATLDSMVDRCAEHCLIHGIPHFTFALHGGEPLLAGAARFERLIARARQRFATISVATRFILQTNGVLLNDAWCESLKAWGVRVGVSVDGPADVHNLQRMTHSGMGSYESVVAGFKCAQIHGLKPGLLTVIDPASDPHEAFVHLKALRPNLVDFLLPEGNHALPPKGLSLGSSGTPYADWLLKVFELWWNEASPPFRVRLFEQIMGATMGLPFRSDALGNQENEVLVVETNGDIGPVDVLRVVLPGASRTGINIETHSLDEGLRQSTVAMYHGSHNSLCAQCRRCPINEICGGGYLPHRFAPRTGFANPSVYCRDLTLLITAIRARALALLPAAVCEQANLRPLSFEQALAVQQTS